MRYHVIYRVLYIIMYLTRGLSNNFFLNQDQYSQISLNSTRREENLQIFLNNENSDKTVKNNFHFKCNFENTSIPQKVSKCNKCLERKDDNSIFFKSRNILSKVHKNLANLQIKNENFNPSKRNDKDLKLNKIARFIKKTSSLSKKSNNKDKIKKNNLNQTSNKNLGNNNLPHLEINNSKRINNHVKNRRNNQIKNNNLEKLAENSHYNKKAPKNDEADNFILGNEKSLSDIIEPLTSQLGKLVLTINKLNENLNKKNAEVAKRNNKKLSRRKRGLLRFLYSSNVTGKYLRNLESLFGQKLSTLPLTSSTEKNIANFKLLTEKGSRVKKKNKKSMGKIIVNERISKNGNRIKNKNQNEKFHFPANKSKHIKCGRLGRTLQSFSDYRIPSQARRYQGKFKFQNISVPKKINVKVKGRRHKREDTSTEEYDYEKYIDESLLTTEMYPDDYDEEENASGSGDSVWRDYSEDEEENDSSSLAENATLTSVKTSESVTFGSTLESTTEGKTSPKADTTTKTITSTQTNNNTSESIKNKTTTDVEASTTFKTTTQIEKSATSELKSSTKANGTTEAQDFKEIKTIKPKTPAISTTIKTSAKVETTTEAQNSAKTTETQTFPTTVPSSLKTENKISLSSVSQIVTVAVDKTTIQTTAFEETSEIASTEPTTIENFLEVATSTTSATTETIYEDLLKTEFISETTFKGNENNTVTMIVSAVPTEFTIPFSDKTTEEITVTTNSPSEPTLQHSKGTTITESQLLTTEEITTNSEPKLSTSTEGPLTNSIPTTITESQSLRTEEITSNSEQKSSTSTQGPLTNSFPTTNALFSAQKISNTEEISPTSEIFSTSTTDKIVNTDKISTTAEISKNNETSTLKISTIKHNVTTNEATTNIEKLSTTNETPITEKLSSPEEILNTEESPNSKKSPSTQKIYTDKLSSTTEEIYNSEEFEDFKKIFSTSPITEEISSSQDMLNTKETLRTNSVSSAEEIVSGEKLSSTQTPSNGKETSDGKNIASTPEMEDINKTSSTGEISSTEESSSVEEILSSSELSSIQDTLNTEETTSSKNPSSTKESFSVEEILSTQKVSSIQGTSSTEEILSSKKTSSNEETSTTDEILSTQKVSSIPDIFNTEEILSSQKSSSSEEKSSTEEILSTQKVSSIQGASSTEEILSSQKSSSTEETSTTEKILISQELSSIKDTFTTEEILSSQKSSSTEETSSTEEILSTQNVSSIPDTFNTAEILSSQKFQRPSSTEETSSVGERLSTQKVSSTEEILSSQKPLGTEETSTPQEFLSTKITSNSEEIASSQKVSNTNKISSTTKFSSSEETSITEENLSSQQPSSSEETSTTEEILSTQKVSSIEGTFNAEEISSSQKSSSTDEASSTEEILSTQEFSSTKEPFNSEEISSTQISSTSEKISTSQILSSTTEISETKGTSRTQLTLSTEETSNSKLISNTEAMPSTEETINTKETSNTVEAESTEISTNTKESSVTVEKLTSSSTEETIAPLENMKFTKPQESSISEFEELLKSSTFSGIEFSETSSLKTSVSSEISTTTSSSEPGDNSELKISSSLEASSSTSQITDQTSSEGVTKSSDNEETNQSSLMESTVSEGSSLSSATSSTSPKATSEPSTSFESTSSFGDISSTVTDIKATTQESVDKEITQGTSENVLEESTVSKGPKDDEEVYDETTKSDEEESGDDAEEQGSGSADGVDDYEQTSSRSTTEEEEIGEKGEEEETSSRSTTEEEKGEEPSSSSSSTEKDVTEETTTENEEKTAKEEKTTVENDSEEEPTKAQKSTTNKYEPTEKTTSEEDHETEENDEESIENDNESTEENTKEEPTKETETSTTNEENTEEENGNEEATTSDTEEEVTDEETLEKQPEGTTEEDVERTPIEEEIQSTEENLKKETTEGTFEEDTEKEESCDGTTEEDITVSSRKCPPKSMRKKVTTVKTTTNQERLSPIEPDCFPESIFSLDITSKSPVEKLTIRPTSSRTVEEETSPPSKSTSIPNELPSITKTPEIIVIIEESSDQKSQTSTMDQETSILTEFTPEFRMSTFEETPAEFTDFPPLKQSDDEKFETQLKKSEVEIDDKNRELNVLANKIRVNEKKLERNEQEELQVEGKRKLEEIRRKQKELEAKQTELQRRIQEVENEVKRKAEKEETETKTMSETDFFPDSVENEKDNDKTTTNKSSKCSSSNLKVCLNFSNNSRTEEIPPDQEIMLLPIVQNSSKRNAKRSSRKLMTLNENSSVKMNLNLFNREQKPGLHKQITLKKKNRIFNEENNDDLSERVKRGFSFKKFWSCIKQADSTTTNANEDVNEKFTTVTHDFLFPEYSHRRNNSNMQFVTDTTRKSEVDSYKNNHNPDEFTSRNNLSANEDEEEDCNESFENCQECTNGNNDYIDESGREENVKNKKGKNSESGKRTNEPEEGRTETINTKKVLTKCIEDRTKKPNIEQNVINRNEDTETKENDQCKETKLINKEDNGDEEKGKNIENQKEKTKANEEIQKQTIPTKLKNHPTSSSSVTCALPMIILKGNNKILMKLKNSLKFPDENGKTNLTLSIEKSTQPSSKNYTIGDDNCDENIISNIKENDSTTLRNGKNFAATPKRKKNKKKSYKSKTSKAVKKNHVEDAKRRREKKDKNLEKEEEKLIKKVNHLLLEVDDLKKDIRNNGKKISNKRRKKNFGHNSKRRKLSIKKQSSQKGKKNHLKEVKEETKSSSDVIDNKKSQLLDKVLRMIKEGNEEKTNISDSKKNRRNIDLMNSKRLSRSIVYQVKNAIGNLIQRRENRKSNPKIDTNADRKHFKNTSTFANVNNVMSRIKNSLKKRNLENVEKIILYKDKGGKDDETVNFESNRNLNFDSDSYSEISLSNAALEKIVSLVADKAMKSINNSHSASTDSTVYVKVIQPVSLPEQLEEFKSEFRFDLSEIIKKAKVHSLQTRENVPLNLPSVRKDKNQKSEKLDFQIIQYKDERKMNLPEKPFSKRRFWHAKMKKKENPLLIQLREEIFNELKTKFGENNKQFYFDSNRERRKRNLQKKKRIIPEFAENVKKLVDSEETKDNQNNVTDPEVQNMSKKIIKFIHEIQANPDKIAKIRNTHGIELDEIVNKFGESELGLKNENDKRNLNKIIHQLVNEDKNNSKKSQLTGKNNVSKKNSKGKIASNSKESESVKRGKLREIKKEEKTEKKIVSNENRKFERIFKYKSRKVHSINDSEKIFQIPNKLTNAGKIKDKKAINGKINARFQKVLTRHLCNYGKKDKKSKVDKTKENTSKQVKNKELKQSKFFGKRVKKSLSAARGQKINNNPTYRNLSEEKFVSQTIIPINEKIRVKYIFRNNSVALGKNRDIRENRNNGKAIGENCENCICDLNQAILDMSNILKNRSDILDKLENYRCNLFVDIGNEIILMDTDEDLQAQVRRNLDETRGLKYVESENVENTLKLGIVSNNDYEVFSLPGYNMNLPCNHEGEDFLWMMSISKPNYTWTREDNFPISGIVRKNGNLELFDVDIKDSGNYLCFITYIDPENEETVRNTYKHSLQVVTLPRYALRGGNQYKLDVCDDAEIEEISTFFPKKLKEILCKDDICETFILPPHCHRQRISINVLVAPSNIAKLVPVGLNLCGIRCRKAVQDKIALLLSRNVRAVLQRPIVFRLPHHREKLVPVDLSVNKHRCKRCRTKKNRSLKNIGDVGLLIGCPAGFNFQNTHCLPCLAGFYSEDGSSHCKKCPLGTHQPNTGARACQTCTNPFVEGCHEMVLNLSIIIIILVLLFIIVLICSIVLCSCSRRSKKRKTVDCARISELDIKDYSDRKPLLKMKKKRTPNSNREINLNRLEFKKKNPKDRFDRKSDKNGYVLVSRVESYNSHQCDYENHSPKKSSRFKPPVPEPDFDR